ncbi:hypothetical protein [Paenibacillus gallinarum]|uniref:Uncharacterized protein n=1 Tax=Paenibacillus gallinarum TaxID=2762232 RepID=A0ABR8T0C4_9BACL|nr:hypothetical protein [Paenibacillus gallinarum]MBD7969201.1 hypothetical protein [Paenibacillus gallinarum]
MYFVLGMILSAVVFLLLTLTSGEMGGLIFLFILAGLIGSLYGENQKLKERINNIEKFHGIDEASELNMDDEEIEKELEQYIEPRENNN